MLIDVFQFSNIYTLGQPITWLASEESIAEECGVYSIKSGQSHMYFGLSYGDTKDRARLSPSSVVDIAVALLETKGSAHGARMGQIWGS